MKQLRILVVEDDALLGILLGEILVEMGHRVCAVTGTVAGAVSGAAQHKPELLIVDAWLRDGSGLSAVKKICETGYVPHPFASGDISFIKTQRPDAVMIQKPYHVADLFIAIEQAIAVESFRLGSNFSSASGTISNFRSSRN
jgi:DNA-binding NtrC family response regulator